MRARCLICLLALKWGVVATSALAETDFPYKTAVAINDADVRSGPGDEYYATAKLTQGEPIEVYRHAPGGWCAIRPPKGSFSWVSARYIQRSNESQIGVTTETDVPARVGTNFGRDRHVVQVRLDAGEKVEILGEQNNGGQTWFRIAPPSGEFRWIAQASLISGGSEVQPEIQTAEQGAPLSPPEFTDRSNAKEPEVRSDAAGLSRDRRDPPLRTAGQVSNTPWRPSSETIPIKNEMTPLSDDTSRTKGQHSPVSEQQPAASGTPPNTKRWHKAGEPSWREPQNQSTQRQSSAKQLEENILPYGPRSTHAQETPYRLAPGYRSVKTSTRREAFVATSPNSKYMEARDATDFALSHMVAKRPTQWNFHTLRQRATALLAAAPTANDRSDVRQILAKIARFEEIQHRRAAIGEQRMAAAKRRSIASTNVRQRNRVRPRFPTQRPEQTPPSPVPVQSERPAQMETARRVTLPNQGWTSAPIVSNRLDSPANSERRDRLNTRRDDDRQPARRPGDVVQIPSDEEVLPDNERRFDASGVLKRVGSRRRNAPRFALVDAKGNIASFITPRPGVNIQPFVGQHVGVYGSRGFMPEYRRAHVTAARITPLATR